MLTTNDPSQGSGTGDSMLLTVILKYDQTMTFESTSASIWRQRASGSSPTLWKRNLGKECMPCFSSPRRI